MKKDLRSKTVGCKMTEAEHANLQSLADQKGQALSDWCRDALLACADSKDEAAPQPSAGAPLGILLEEILALRTIVTTILFHLGQGKPVEEADMKALIAKADDSKKRRATELQTIFRQQTEADR